MPDASRSVTKEVLAGDLRCLVVTFAIALSSGWVCLQLGIPAPYLMGSLFGVWFGGSLVKPLRPHLGVARWFHKPVVLGLGVLIGATFNQTVLAQAGQWWLTLTTMIVTTVIVTVIGYQFLRRARGYEPPLAPVQRSRRPGRGHRHGTGDGRSRLCGGAVPPCAGGDCLRIHADASRPDRRPAGVDRSNTALLTMPSIFSLPATDIVTFVGLGLFGWFLAKWGRVPMPHLIGPVGISTLFHLMGWAELPRVNEFVILAQLAIGGAVGARLAKVPFRELLGYLRDACAATALILTAYLLATVLVAKATGVGFLTAGWPSFRAASTKLPCWR